MHAKAHTVTCLKALASIVRSKVISVVLLFDDAVLSNRVRERLLVFPVRINLVCDTFLFDRVVIFVLVRDFFVDDILYYRFFYVLN